MKEAKEVLSFPLPSERDAPELLEPGEEPFHQPTTLVSSEGSAVLSSPAGDFAPSHGSDQFNVALLGELLLERLAIPGLVSDQFPRQLINERSVESSVGENNVVPGSASNSDREWKTIAVCERHDLCRLAGTAPADAGPPFFAPT